MKRKDSDKKKKKDYTSLVGVKWTQESLEECLLDMFNRYHDKLLKDPKMSDAEKFKRHVHLYTNFSKIYLPINRYGVTVKKA